VARIFHAYIYGTGGASTLASRSNDLETHIQDVLGVLKFEDLREVTLIGHSYGGLVATGVADRTPDRIARLIYLDAFVPTHGQALIDLLPAGERERLLDSVKTGDGWRVTPNPIPPDTSAEDTEWITKFRMPQSVKCRAAALFANRNQFASRIYSLHEVCRQKAVRSVR
jgi:pimeloyl-ACP methyl ester carboxylesterase